MAPVNLSLVNSPEETISFIGKIKEKFDQKRKVFVRLDYVKNISYDALVILLSIMIRFKSNKIPFNGNFPEDPIAKKIIWNSGFFDYLYREIREDDRYELIKGGYISTHAFKLVDSELTHNIISDATTTIWNEKRRCQGVQRSLIELMQNTNNHAVIDKEGEKHWFLSVQHRKKEDIVSFSFIDFGVGVFESLSNKKNESKWFDWQNKLEKVFSFKNNTDILKLILNGNMHKSVTGKPYRGKGLPGIYSSFKRNQMSNLHIITNDVHANLENNTFLRLNNKFSGTFIYWELNKSNLSTHGID